MLSIMPTNVMKLLLSFFCLLLIISCKQQQSKPMPHAVVANTATVINYDSCKKQITIIKNQNNATWHSASKNEKEKIFTKAVTETIIPKWIGTAWDFNGITQTPQQGSIACGYFVTTVLRDAGVNIARVKLAQCASEQMITTLVQPKYIQRFSNIALQNFIEAIKQLGYGLYIVGLDNHTGFIYNDGKEIYFIHSTFVGTRNVQKEKASTSWVLQKSKYKVLGKISTDEVVLNKWMY